MSSAEHGGRLSNCGIISGRDLPDVASFGPRCVTRLTADYLCELADEKKPVSRQKEEATGGQPVLMPVLGASTAALPVPTVVCPNRHFTHTFMAFDPASNCWQLGNSYSESKSWDIHDEVPYSTPLMQLPPMMACDSGVQHVPYSLVCDHQQQCDDGSDESFCVFPPCSQHKPVRCLLSAQVCIYCM